MNANAFLFHNDVFGGRLGYNTCYVSIIPRSQVVSLPLQSVIHGGANFCAEMDTLIDQDVYQYTFRYVYLSYPSLIPVTHFITHNGWISCMKNRDKTLALKTGRVLRQTLCGLKFKKLKVARGCDNWTEPHLTLVSISQESSRISLNGMDTVVACQTYTLSMRHNCSMVCS